VQEAGGHRVIPYNLSGIVDPKGKGSDRAAHAKRGLAAATQQEAETLLSHQVLPGDLAGVVNPKDGGQHGAGHVQDGVAAATHQEAVGSSAGINEKSHDLAGVIDP